MQVIISENSNFIALQVICEDEKSLSWEELQNIKDRYFRKLDFIEVYPKQKEIINKANVRHLVHLKNWSCPKLEDLEQECKIKIHTI